MITPDRLSSPAPGPDRDDGSPPPPEPGADDGVDVTLIRWMLSLSPRQRLRALTSSMRSIERLRHARILEERRRE